MKNVSSETDRKIKKSLSAFPKGRQKSAILNILHILQKKNGGWLSQDSLDYAAKKLDITPIEVYEVATFYSMFNLAPVGKYVFEVCQTGPCMLRGSDDIIHYIHKKLNIQPGETTKDGLFTLKVVECLGACGYAPMMQRGDKYEEFLTEEKIDSIIESVKKKYVSSLT